MHDVLQTNRLDADTLRRRQRTSMVLFFLFMLLHQTDRYLIGPLSTPIMNAFHINEAEMGAVSTGAILVGAVFFPLWGYLFDRYIRPRILALAGLIWGATTWLAAVVTTYPLFIAARASTGIKDAAYPGIYSMVSDLFGPERRGRIIATLQLAAPVSFLIATGMALTLVDVVGWRGVFVITGALGVLMAALNFLILRDVPRGTSEPELQGQDALVVHRFSWQSARELLRKPTLILLFVQQFVLLFPLQAISFWYFRYMQVDRQLSKTMIGLNSGLFVVLGMAGYLTAGALGDWAFRRSMRGRLLVGGIGISLAAVLIVAALSVPSGQDLLFTVLMAFAALLIDYAHPNVITTVHDITKPEVRSTAQAIIGIADQSGSALAPLLVGIIALDHTLQFGLVTVCGIGFALSAILLLTSSLVVKKDILSYRAEMQERAALNKAG